MSIVKHENEWKYADSAYLTLQKVLHLISPSPSPFDKSHAGNMSGRSPFRLCGDKRSKSVEATRCSLVVRWMRKLRSMNFVGVM
jgi:hypothetical protein